MAIKSAGYAAVDAGSPLQPLQYELPDLKENDVLVEVHYCGITHTDVDFVKNQYKSTKYPVVPGHEIVGVVSQVGPSVKALQIGDRVGVGYHSSACGNCKHCHEHNPQFCDFRTTTVSQHGGYGRYVIVKDQFATKIPNEIKSDTAGPLFSSGIILYNTMTENNFMRGNLRIGVLGCGGMGHLAIQFASKINPSNQVYGIELSDNKTEEVKKLGAQDLLVLSDTETASKYQRFFHYIIDAVTEKKDYSTILTLLQPRGSIIVAAPGTGNIEVAPFPIIGPCLIIQTASFGGMQRMAEMLQFCQDHKIECQCEMVPLSDINEAHKRIEAGDVKFKFITNVKDSAPVVA